MEEDNWIHISVALARAFEGWEKAVEAELATQFSEEEYPRAIRYAQEDRAEILDDPA